MAANAQPDLNIFNLDFLGKQETVVAAPDEQAVRPTRGTFWDHSGTIATANVSQLVAKEKQDRRYFLFQNVDAAATIWLNFTLGAQTSQPSIQLPPGATYILESSFVTTERVHAISSTAGAAFVCKEA